MSAEAQYLPNLLLRFLHMRQAGVSILTIYLELVALSKLLFYTPTRYATLQCHIGLKELSQSPPLMPQEL